MGSIIGQLHIIKSSNTTGSVSSFPVAGIYEARYDSGNTVFICNVYEAEGMAQYIANLGYPSRFIIDNDDVIPTSALVEWEYLITNVVSMSVDTDGFYGYPLTPNTILPFSTSNESRAFFYPYILKGSVYNRTHYGMISTDSNYNYDSNYSSGYSYNRPFFVKIGGRLYFAYRGTVTKPESALTFMYMQGWENAHIFPIGTGNLRLDPSSIAGQVRPYTIEYSAYYNNSLVDNSLVQYSVHYSIDGVEITNNEIAYIDNGTLYVGALAPTSIYVKAQYADSVTWASSSSIVFPDGAYTPGGSSSSGGGGGSYGGGTFGGGGQSSSDDIASNIPVGGANNTIGASSMMYTRYLLTKSDLDFIGEWLWSPTLGLNIAKLFVSTFYGSPIDAIVSLYAFPFSIGGYMNGYSAQQQVFCYGGAKAAIAGTAHTPLALLSNGVSFNWGSLKIDEYWGNFLDYAPHTTIELYLPWGVGFIQLDTNQVMGRTITITTNIDLNKGTCVHNIFDDLGCVIGTYSGQCAKQLPITALDNASKLAGITATAINTAAKGANTIANNAQTATTLWGTAEGTMHDIFRDSGRRPALASATALAMSPPQVQRNGSFSDASSFMGVQYPYITISRPTQSVPEEYGHHYGYPSNIYQGLRYLSGYTEIGEIHLTGIPCTDSELMELDKVLKGGVLF